MKEFGEFAKVLQVGLDLGQAMLADNLYEIGKHQQIVAAELIGHEIPEWAPLAESTVKEKQRLGYTGQVSETDPLLRTGANRESIEVSVEVETLTEVTGSNRPEFLFMEMGTPTVPARPSLAIAAVGSLDFAGDVMTNTAVRMLTGEAKQ